MKKNDQKIKCEVEDCKYCDCSNLKCELEEIKVCNCDNCNKKEATMCDSYKSKKDK